MNSPADNPHADPYLHRMDDTEFDKAVIRAAFDLAERTGWHRMSLAAAASEAGLPLARTRERLPNRLAVLGRFGKLADEAMLADLTPESGVRDRLFDMVMRRIDVLQAHRGGMLALLRALPTDPGLALLLGMATQRSMRWMLEAAGVGSVGLRGELRTRGLVAVWLWVVRAWRTDDSPDLSATMAALDTALTRAEQAAAWLRDGGHDTPAADDIGEPQVSEAPDLPMPLDLPPEAPPSPPTVL